MVLHHTEVDDGSLNAGLWDLPTIEILNLMLLVILQKLRPPRGGGVVRRGEQPPGTKSYYAL